MARPASEYPTELELQILKLLWADSPLLVREIRARLARMGRKIAHTSVITTLNTMFDKGQVRRNKDGKSFLFSPRLKQEDVSHGMLSDVVHRVFDGSASAVLLSLFETSDLDEDEVRELRRLINRKLREQQS